jgi:SAM-dependent methyltransferase
MNDPTLEKAEVRRTVADSQVRVEDMRSRLYEAYASTHAGKADEVSAAIAFRQDVLPHLPLDKRAVVVDIGCGQGQLVRQLLLHGYEQAQGVDVSPEQVALAHRAGIREIRLGDYRTVLEDGSVDAVVATDFFEHLTKLEVLDALDHVHRALRSGGTCILRVPNAVSPFGGNFRHGDVTHETWFTARNLRQFGAAAGFARTDVYPCPPRVHGAKSAARAAAWKVASGAMKLVLAAETGVVRGHLVTQNIVGVLQKG